VSNLVIREYQPGDIAAMDLRWIYKNEDDVVERTENVIRSDNAHAHTIVKFGKPIAVVGGDLLWKGVAQIWSVSSPEIEKYPVFYTRTSRMFLRLYHDLFGIRRYQCAVRCDFKSGQRWAEALGFTSEGIMRGYGPDGADHFLYARVI